MKAILNIERHNWGLCTAYDWSIIRYLLYPDGSYKQIGKNGLGEEMAGYSCNGKLPDKEFSKMKKLINKFNSFEQYPNIKACDGEAFEIITYDETGKEINHRGLDYIYGIKTLESMIKIFDKVCL